MQFTYQISINENTKILLKKKIYGIYHLKSRASKNSGEIVQSACTLEGCWFESNPGRTLVC